MLLVTVDVFSGFLNPSWVIGPDEARDILKKIASNQDVIAEVDSGFQGLGYRGMLLEPLAEEMGDELGVPQEFAIANGASANEPKGREIAARLIETASPEPATDFAAVMDEGLKTFILDQLAAATDSLPADVPEEIYITEDDGLEDEAVDAKCRIELGKFNPGFWNNDPNVRRNNNCYNYGRNRKTNTFAQPGRASGAYPYSINCGNVEKGALSDGGHRRFDCFPDSEKPRWLMAMVVWPGRDYHWYRKHKERFWGHKPGGTAAKNTDNSGRVIYDPRKCDRGPYTNFCGFYYACKSMKIK